MMRRFVESWREQDRRPTTPYLRESWVGSSHRPYVPNYRRRLVQDHNVIELGEDIISHLPDSILSRILSQLPTRDAVKTSVLSRDWEFKWTLVYNLTFNEEVGLENLSELRALQFMNFVERVLHLCGTPTVEKFELLLAVNYEFYDSTRVNSWIVNVLRRNVQNVNLVNVPNDSVLPRYFFCSDSLMYLKLTRCSFKAPSHVCLSNLKELNLSYVKVRNDDFSDASKLVLKLPVVEVLFWHFCEWQNVKVLTIDAPRLLVFESRFPRYASDTGRSIDCKLEICQVNLEIFRRWGRFLDDFVLSSPSTANYVELRQCDFGMGDHPLSRRRIGFRACALLGGFSVVTSCLEISRDILVALSYVNPPCSLPVLERLTHLKLSTHREPSADNIQCNKALVNLLKMVPALELLTICTWRSSSNDDDFEGVDLLPANFLSRLKVIKFQFFCGREDEMQLVQFLLHNASSLDKMIIGPVIIGSGIFGNQPVEVRNRLLKLPRGSSHASIVFSP